jgi:hypothetical protein
MNRCRPTSRLRPRPSLRFRPAPDRFDRDLTTFVRGADGSYRRGDEHHGNILIDTSLVPALLRERGVTAAIGRLIQ